MAAVPSIGRASLVERPNVAPQAAETAGLYERHAAKIQSYCQHQLGSREEAEDAVQTTFMNAFRALGRGVVPEAEAAWLFKIAENVCLSRRRSSWRRGRIESPSDFDVIEEIIPGPNRQRDELIGIEDALASMPEQQRRAILLREWQGLSYREVAEELEISQSAVETLIFRARRSLAQGLEQPDTIKKPKRKSFRRALHVVDFGTVVAALKTLLAGSAAVKATAAAVAVTAVAGTAASVAPKIEPRSADLAAAPRHVVSAPASVEAAAPPATRVPFAAAVAQPASNPPVAVTTRAQHQPDGAAGSQILRRTPDNGVAPVESIAATAPAVTAEATAPVAEEATPTVQPATVEPSTDQTSYDEGVRDEGNADGTDRRTEGVVAPVAPVLPVVQPSTAPAVKGKGGRRRGIAPTGAGVKVDAVIAQASAQLAALVSGVVSAPVEAAQEQATPTEQEPVTTAPLPVIEPVVSVAPGGSVTEPVTTTTTYVSPLDVVNALAGSLTK